MKRIGVKVPPTASALEAEVAVIATLREGAEEVGRTFTKPDDDWWPIWMVATPTQGTVMTPESLRDNAEKERMTATVAAYARRRGATVIGHLHSVWHVPPEKISRERSLEIFELTNRQDGSTEGVPEREEAVQIVVYTATTFRMVLAPITRHEDGPPTLGRFAVTISSADKGADLRGRMTDPLRDSLRRYG